MEANLGSGELARRCGVNRETLRYCPEALCVD